jgi:hypothetical protein
MDMTQRHEQHQMKMAQMKEAAIAKNKQG